MRSARSGSVARAAAGGWPLRAALSLLLSQPAIVGAVDNGIGALRACSFHSSRGSSALRSLTAGCCAGLTPPMGWRHWKAFYADISQEIMESMMDEMVKKYPVDGVPTSLKDLGYLYVVRTLPVPAPPRRSRQRQPQPQRAPPQRRRADPAAGRGRGSTTTGRTARARAPTAPSSRAGARTTTSTTRAATTTPARGRRRGTTTTARRRWTSTASPTSRA